MNDDKENQTVTLRKFTDIGDDKEKGMGNLHKLPSNLVISVIEYLPPKDGLKVFQLSKTMYNICNQERTWKIFS